MCGVRQRGRCKLGLLTRGVEVTLTSLAIVARADEKNEVIVEGRGSGARERSGSCTGGEGDNGARLCKGKLCVSGSCR